MPNPDQKSYSSISFPPPSTSAKKSLNTDVNSYFQKLKRRWKPALIVFLTTIGTTGIGSLFLPPNYQAEGKLIFAANLPDSVTGINNDSPSSSNSPVNSPNLNNELQRLQTGTMLQQIIKQLQLTDDAGTPLQPQDLKEGLSLRLLPGKDIIQVKYQDQDPQIAAKIVNTLMDVYIQGQLHNQQSQSNITEEFINQKLPTIESKLAEEESALANFRSEHHIIDLKAEKSAILTGLSNLNLQIATNKAQLQGIQAQTSALQNQLGMNLNQALAVEQLGKTPLIESTLDQLARTETELAEERARFQDSHPNIQALEAKKAQLTQTIDKAIRQSVGTKVRISQGLLSNNRENQETPLEKFISLKIEELSQQRQLDSLNESYQSYLTRAKELPSLEQQEHDLLRQIETANSTYNNLRDTLQNLQLTQNLSTAPAEILETADVPQQNITRKIALMVGGILLGILFSNLTVILLEMQDRSLKTISEIKQKLPYNVLGMIPLDSEAYKQGVVVEKEPDSFTSEIYRIIQTNLKFITASESPKVILVTSSVPGEGKSTVTANLGAAIAQLGRKVLLIDGDLRRSHQQQLWEVSNEKGLQDIVAQKVPFKEVIAQPINNLDLLTTGGVATNPLAILDSVEIKQLIAQSRKEYDLVLIDAPPLPVTADVLTWSKLADGIIFVSRPKVLEQESADLAQETLVNTKRKILGMIINGISPQEFDRYSYYAKYGKVYTNSQK